MTAPMRSDCVVVPVALGPRSYDIAIGRGVISTLGTRIAALRPGAKAFIVTDQNVAHHAMPAAEAALKRAGVVKRRKAIASSSRSARPFSMRR